MLTIHMQDDPNTYPVAQMLEEETGYKVKYYTLPQENPSEKLNMIMASNESYDIIHTNVANGLDNCWAEYAQKGALYDLSEFIEQYGTNTKQAMSQASLDLTKIDGKQYAIPMTNINLGNKSLYSSLMTTRADWMEKLGMAYPKTVDEFTALLQAFKDNDIDGQSLSVAPLSMDKTTLDLPGLVGAFGVPNVWNDVDGTLMHRIEDPRYLDYIRYLQELYKAGLLDMEFPTNKAATLIEKFSSGRAGVVPMAYYDAGSIVNALVKNFPDASVHYIDPLTGPNGDSGVAANEKALDRLIYIPKSAEHPEDAFQWMDMKLEHDLFKRMAIGDEGVHYTFENGEYYPIAPKFFDERNLANNFMTGLDEENYPIYWRARVRKDDNIFQAYSYLESEESVKYSVDNPLGRAPVFESNKQKNILDTMVSDYVIQLIVGEVTIEDSYDAFIEKWNNEGGAAMKEEINAWYQNQ